MGEPQPTQRRPLPPTLLPTPTPPLPPLLLALLPAEDEAADAPRIGLGPPDAFAVAAATAAAAAAAAAAA